jgi:hypothetical protein
MRPEWLPGFGGKSGGVTGGWAKAIVVVGRVVSGCG